jgi:hypothetical protein
MRFTNSVINRSSVAMLMMNVVDDVVAETGVVDAICTDEVVATAEVARYEVVVGWS